jgi:SAM-dependent methyltransferase
MLSPGLKTQMDTIHPINTQPIALDIGCGHSIVPFELLNKGWKVICLDYSSGVLDVIASKAAKINQQWLDTKQLTLVRSNVEDYEWPENIDLVLAGSSLPYFNPQKMKHILSSIHQSLVPGGHFIGNIFTYKHSDSTQDVLREMGAWFIKDKDSTGFLLADQGFYIEECEEGFATHKASVVFIAKKKLNITH